MVVLSIQLDALMHLPGQEAAPNKYFIPTVLLQFFFADESCKVGGQHPTHPLQILRTRR